MARQSELVGHLAEVPLFSHCSKRDLQTLARNTEVLEFPEGARIVSQGDAGSAFYVLLEGNAIADMCADVEHEIALSDIVRARGLEVLEVIDRAIAEGFIVAAPDEGACTWCDFRAVCGPREEERVARKKADRLADLQALRAMP